jgi:hypothetical protein
MIWSYDGLWQKTKLYVERALGEEREGPMFPFWAILALELLGRATLARVHPALLADPREGEHLMYAFGFASSKSPKSIPAATVFRRCQKIVPDFTEEDANFCDALISKRNEELHSGSPIFEDLPTAQWLARYYRVCGLFLASQDLTLQDLFGDAESRAATVLIAAEGAKLTSEAKEKIAASAKSYASLPAEEQSGKRNAVLLAVSTSNNGKTIKCPSCGSKAWMYGEPVKTSEPKLAGDSIVTELILIPTRLACRVCGLELNGHNLVHAAGLGGQFSITKEEDIFEAYAPDYDEYGND